MYLSMRLSRRSRWSARTAMGTMLCAWALLVTPRVASGADQAPLVRCESAVRETVRCVADTQSGVTLERQLSRAGCWFDETWGFDAKGIWVSNGCRADFALGKPPAIGATAPKGQAAPGSASGISGQDVAVGAAAALVLGAIAVAVISSQDDDDDDDDRRCRYRDSRGRCVSASDCRYRDSRGRCVDASDCRYRDSRGRCVENDPWDRDKLVRCESQGNKQRYCRVDTRRGVELYRQLSESRCRYGSSWGYNKKGIWVDKGCRAEFAIRG